jgi:hypothetical protein
MRSEVDTVRIINIKNQYDLIPKLNIINPSIKTYNGTQNKGSLNQGNNASKSEFERLEFTNSNAFISQEMRFI